MNSPKKKPIKWLVVWDMLGLETLYNLTKWEEETTWATLKDESRPKAPQLNTILLRARANAQRKYEIYIFTSVGLSEEDIRNSFENAPQMMAEFIRKNGLKIYSDHSTNANQVIF